MIVENLLQRFMSSSLTIISEPGEKKSCGSVTLNVLNQRSVLGAEQFRGKAAIVTLGCAKNQVDSEVMLGVLRNNGYEIVNDLEQADVAIVNTCGFLESSVQESIDCVLDVARLKETARLRRLIVAGCMVERFKGDIRTALPEVDNFVGLDDILNVHKVLDDGSSVKDLLSDAARPYFLYDESAPRQLASLPHFAYVKVSEGCDRPCTFCVIPRIRGEMRSRPIPSIVSEIKQLGVQGVKEVNLVAQDLTSYGKDIKEGNLAALLRQIDQAEAVDWVRLLYAYPIGIDEELLRTIVECKSICNYLDLPLQHSSENVLKLMKRPVGRYGARKIVEFINNVAPEINLRTTFIVGFPGETEQDIKDLEDFVSAGYFSSVGVFTYSREEGTPSYDLPNQVPEEEKALRRERIMKAQQDVIEETLEGYVGQTLPVLVEGLHEETDLLMVGRAEFQAPEVDGSVIINDIEGSTDNFDNVPQGQIRLVKITDISGYDLIGTLIS